MCVSVVPSVCLLSTSPVAFKFVTAKHWGESKCPLTTEWTWTWFNVFLHLEWTLHDVRDLVYGYAHSTQEPVLAHSRPSITSNCINHLKAHSHGEDTPSPLPPAAGLTSLPGRQPHRHTGLSHLWAALLHLLPVSSCPRWQVRLIPCLPTIAPHHQGAWSWARHRV